MRPPSFDEELMGHWSVWVLDHGLPLHPGSVEIGQAVPIARWVGPKFGAVVHVDWSWSDDHRDDSLSTEVEVFRRGPAGWEPSYGSGGGGWFEPPFRRPDLSHDYAALMHHHASGSDDWRCCAAYGVAGTSATIVEVIDSEGSTRQPIESPLGVFLVAADGEQRAIARVLGSDGEVLMETPFAPELPW